MKKAAGLFFLLNLFLILPLNALAQESISLTIVDGYKASKVLDNLNNSNYFTFDFTGNFILTENSGKAIQVVKYSPLGEKSVLLDHLTQAPLGLSFHDGWVYVISKGRISVIKKGKLTDIIGGLPAAGDYANSSVIFQGNKLYFGIGTATNSGVVGPDNAWLANSPSVHDLLCRTLKLNKINISSDNILTKKNDDKATTGAFMPYNTPVYADQVGGSSKCNGAIMRANPDGSGLQLVAFGLHNPKGLSFDSSGKLYVLDQAMEDRGLRPIKSNKDSLFKITDGTWYGWPDYNAGKLSADPVIAEVPNPAPMPESVYDPGHLTQFTINQFGVNSGLAINDGTVISEFALDLGKLSDFAKANSGYKIAQIKFGPDKSLYVLLNDGKTSQLWKIESKNPTLAGLGVASPSKGLPIAWSLSITAMVVGLLATYVVYKSQQKNLGV